MKGKHLRRCVYAQNLAEHLGLTMYSDGKDIVLSKDEDGVTLYFGGLRRAIAYMKGYLAASGKKHPLPATMLSDSKHVLDQLKQTMEAFVLCGKQSGLDIEPGRLNALIRDKDLRVEWLVDACREALEEHFSSC